MTPTWQIHRHALIWLFAAFSSVILIHAEHLPLWILLAAIFSMIWQVQRYRGVWSTPTGIVKYGLLALCLAGLFLEYGKSVSLEPMVALLVSTFTLKLLEMEHRRDALLVIFLAFFVAALQALFDQSIGNSVYILGCLLLVITALVGLHQGVPDGGEGTSQPLRPLRASAVLLLQAIPLMLLFFLIMPRLGSFWSVPIQGHSAKTGMSDKMSPGNFSRLGRSADVAFRVSFEGDIPRQHQLYWRGLILSDFDGRTWSRTDPIMYEQSNLLQWFGKKEQSWDTLIERNGQPTEYSVILEPTQQVWLYSLPTPLPKSHGVALTRDFRLLSSRPITRKTQYDVHSWLDYRISAQRLPSLQRAITLQLPQGYNPRSLVLARSWRKNIRNDLQIVQQALSLYNHEFTYTLSPPLLGTHSV